MAIYVRCDKCKDELTTGDELFAITEVKVGKESVFTCSDKDIKYICRDCYLESAP